MVQRVVANHMMHARPPKVKVVLIPLFMQNNMFDNDSGFSTTCKLTCRPLCFGQVNALAIILQG